MTMNELKAAVRAHMTDDQVRAFGKLTTKATWEAAYDKCQEAVALAADAAQEAQQPAQDAAQVVTEAVYSELSAKVFYSVVYVVGWSAIALILLTVKLTQSAWQASAPMRHRASGRISQWATAQASYLALVLLILKSA